MSYKNTSGMAMSPFEFTQTAAPAIQSGGTTTPNVSITYTPAETWKVIVPPFPILPSPLLPGSDMIADEILKHYQVDQIFFEPPYTTIKWKCGCTSQSKAMDGDDFNPHVGFAQAVANHLSDSKTATKKMVDAAWEFSQAKRENKKLKKLKAQLKAKTVMLTEGG